MRPTYANIHLPALVANYRALLATTVAHASSSASLVAVVKADAYGHGAAACGRALAAEGAGWLGITSVDEAITLRRALGALHPRLLVMSGFFPGEEGAILQHGLTPHAWEGYHFGLLDAAARRAGAGPRSIPVHLELDTGMSRQGVAPGAPLGALLGAAGLAESDSPLFVEAVLTHFASPEELDNPVLDQQVACLQRGLEQLAAAGIRPRLLHAGNSANASAGLALGSLAALARAHHAALLVRPGLALYGIPVHFSPESPQACPLQPVLSLHSEVTSLRDVPAHTAVGYNQAFRTATPSRLALLPIGYADGLNRQLSNRGTVLVRGQRAPLVGRISMDQAILDVTGIPSAALGDTVTLLGQQGHASIDAWEMASLCGTIPYEITCAIGSRVPRLLTR